MPGPRRLALIISHETFEDARKEARDGNDRDVGNLKCALEKYGFTVRVYKDLKKNMILSVLTNINYESLSDHDCIMVIVSTHGSKGGVLLAKDKEFYTKDVWGPFRDCDKLKHIPKVFIFQACRGKKIERRISQEKYMSLEEEICAVPVLPHQKEFLLVHSTIPDYCSKRDFQNGTIFIQAFCNQLEAFFKREGKVELVPLLTEVNNQVTVSSEERGESQTSTFTSFLHQPLILKNEVEKEQQHVSKKSEKAFLPTSYDCEGKSVAIVLYTEQYEHQVGKIEKLLKCRHSSVELISIPDNLNTISEMSDGSWMKGACSLTVIVLGQLGETKMTDHCEILFVKTSNCEIRLKDIWSHFKASRCQRLGGKPKLFFFCDFLNRSDYPGNDSITTTDSINMLSEPVNNHSDFLWAFCYGKKMFEKLKDAFLYSSEEITQMLTTAIRNAESTSTSRKISHFESTLKLQFYFRPSSKQTPSLQQDLNSLQQQENTSTESFLNQSLSSSEGCSKKDQEQISNESSLPPGTSTEKKDAENIKSAELDTESKIDLTKGSTSHYHEVTNQHDESNVVDFNDISFDSSESDSEGNSTTDPNKRYKFWKYKAKTEASETFSDENDTTNTGNIPVPKTDK